MQGNTCIELYISSKHVSSVCTAYLCYTWLQEQHTCNSSNKPKHHTFHCTSIASLRAFSSSIQHHLKRSLMSAAKPRVSRCNPLQLVIAQLLTPSHSSCTHHWFHLCGQYICPPGRNIRSACQHILAPYTLNGLIWASEHVIPISDYIIQYPYSVDTL
jgi:hypothetical protein